MSLALIIPITEIYTKVLIMNRSIRQIGLLVTLAFALSSCSSKQAQVADNAKEPLKQIGCYLIMPVGTTVDSSVKIKYDEAENLEKGARYVDTVLATELSGHDNARIVDGKQLDSYFPEVKGGVSGVIKEVGTKLGCDAMLLTTVSRFTQREGSTYAVDSPASVAFDMRLINVDTGASLWSTTFSETQQSVMSNVLSWGKAESRGFQWITAEELISQAVKERLEIFPY